MKQKWMKYFCAIALILVTMIGQTGRMTLVNAETSTKSTNYGIADFTSGDASIEIKGNENQSLVGKRFYLYRLFDAENAVGLESIDYTMNEEYASALKKVVGKKIDKDAASVTEYEVIDYMQSLNTNVVEGAQTEQSLEGRYSDYRYFVEELLEEMHAENLSGLEIQVADTKVDNSIEIKGLPYGYYMIEDASDASGEHSAVSLSMLSTANPDFHVNIKADYPTVTKKIQEDDNQDAVGLEGWNDIADYEIGQDVPYRYQSNIPNMNGYDTYYYAWHDVMDEALTLQENSIQIVISGMLDGVMKEYELKAEEYSLITELQDETFIIEVEDIKAIVDREFPQMNHQKENIYGQSVEVIYKATLNDKAAERTGRPGFENDVRLEFSNNPNTVGKGQTGYTPWDTVVCFTYQLNGIKVNDEGTKLEGAVFKLYYDKECEKEVYVKKDAKGYIVMHADSLDGTIPENAASMVSDAGGMFDIYGLDGGVYYLKEVSAPAGYRPILEPIELSVTPVFKAERNSYVKGDGAAEEILKLTATAHINTFVRGETVEENVVLEADAEKGNVNLSVVNEMESKLPITGSYFMPILVFVGIILMCVSVKKGHKKHE